MSVEVYTSSARLSSWKGPFSKFEGGLTKLKPFDQLLEETLKDGACKNLNDAGKEHVKKNLKRSHNLWNPANERLLKSYNAVINALNIMFNTNKDDPKLIEQLTKLNSSTNWDLCIDDTFVERLVLMAIECEKGNKKVINYFTKAYEEGLQSAFKGKGNGRSMYSAPASNCEMTGICHCERGSEQPLKRYSCLLSGAVLDQSAAESTARGDLFGASMGSLFDDDEDDD